MAAIVNVFIKTDLRNYVQIDFKLTCLYGLNKKLVALSLVKLCDSGV